MDIDELSLIGPFDLANVEAIHRKRLLAFINHFIVQTTHFLNKIARSCDGKLLQTELRLQKLEASLILLESKLASIPQLVQPVTISAITENNVASVDVPECAPTENLTQDTPSESETTIEKVNAEPALDDNLLRFVKMLHFGVPVPAVKLKMEQEGISPDEQALVLNHSK